jgi:hypothetical protein
MKTKLLIAKFLTHLCTLSFHERKQNGAYEVATLPMGVCVCVPISNFEPVGRFP